MNLKKRVVAGAVLLAAGVFAAQTKAAVVFSDTFTYPDGALVGAPGSLWANHSGTAGQVNVASNHVQLTETESEDVNAPLTGSPYATGTLYGGADFKFTALPSTATVGGYFFHFKDAGTSNFRGRVFASTAGAAPGFYRIGITNGGNTPVMIPTDLALGDSHHFVMAYDTVAAVATLYLDSPTETGGTVGTDVTTAVGITTVAMRQSLSTGNGMGQLDIDNVVVGTSYSEALSIPEPATLGLAAFGLLALSRRRRA
jgi:hypothetical protein